ncbi:hypothetical protein [Micromonospora zamorensis]|uniref:hypothetical protein n=1 Tax=Micromonospora zamorensis TaxID=709883 RepID=UPI0033A4AF25
MARGWHAYRSAPDCSRSAATPTPRWSRLVFFGVLISWRDSADVLRDMLHQHDLDPNRVESPDAAWRVFRVFLSVDVDGLETAPDSDADGFAVSWGRYSWNDGLPSLSLSRHLVVDVSADWTETEWYQPEYWRLSLDMVFPDQPTLADLDQLNAQDSGVYYERPGPGMNNALREVLWEVEQYPTLQALWASMPLRSAVDLERSC